MGFGLALTAGAVTVVVLPAFLGLGLCVGALAAGGRRLGLPAAATRAPAAAGAAGAGSAMVAGGLWWALAAMRGGPSWAAARPRRAYCSRRVPPRARAPNVASHPPGMDILVATSADFALLRGGRPRASGLWEDVVQARRIRGLTWATALRACT